MGSGQQSGSGTWSDLAWRACLWRRGVVELCSRLSRSRSFSRSFKCSLLPLTRVLLSGPIAHFSDPKSVAPQQLSPETSTAPPPPLPQISAQTCAVFRLARWQQPGQDPTFRWAGKTKTAVRLGISHRNQKQQKTGPYLGRPPARQPCCLRATFPTDELHVAPRKSRT